MGSDGSGGQCERLWLFDQVACGGVPGSQWVGSAAYLTYARVVERMGCGSVVGGSGNGVRGGCCGRSRLMRRCMWGSGGYALMAWYAGE